MNLQAFQDTLPTILTFVATVVTGLLTFLGSYLALRRQERLDQPQIEREETAMVQMLQEMALGLIEPYKDFAEDARLREEQTRAALVECEQARGREQLERVRLEELVESLQQELAELGNQLRGE